MKILITGSEGFVGRHFYAYLNVRHEVLGVDIKNGADCRDYFKTHDEVWDLVIHCAAIVGGREKIEGEPLSVATDLSIDAEMFNWAVRTKQKRIVYFSSSAAYPTSLQNSTYKLRENDVNLDVIKAPDLTYGWSKLTGEMLAGFARKVGVKVYVVRPFSGYGEDQDETYPFPAFVKRVIERQDPFVIWGDGKQVRDFIHIDDIVAAVLKMVEHDVQGPMNIGTGIATSFNDLAKMMFMAAEWVPTTIVHDTSKPVGVMYRVANPKKFLDFYTPKISLKQAIYDIIKTKVESNPSRKA